MVQDFSAFVARQKISEMMTEQSRQAQDAFAILYQILNPMMLRFAHGRKIPRGGVLSLVQPLMGRLQDHPAVVSSQISHITQNRRMSVKEVVVIRSIIMSSIEDYDRQPLLAFFACEMTLTRNNLQVAVHDLDLVVRRHVLERHLTRERRVEGGFLKGLNRTIEIALPVSMVAGQIGENVIALPMGSGLCLGRLYGFPDDIDEPVVYSFAVDRRHGFRTDAVQERPREQFIKNRRLQMVIRTFVDYDSVSGVRERVLERFTALRQRHGDAFTHFFDSYHYGGFVFMVNPGDDRPEVEARYRGAIDAMFNEVKEFVRSPVWKQYAEQARERESLRLMAAP